MCLPSLRSFCAFRLLSKSKRHFHGYLNSQFSTSGLSSLLSFFYNNKSLSPGIFLSFPLEHLDHLTLLSKHLRTSRVQHPSHIMPSKSFDSQPNYQRTRNAKDGAWGKRIQLSKEASRRGEACTPLSNRFSRMSLNSASKVRKAPALRKRATRTKPSLRSKGPSTVVEEVDGAGCTSISPVPSMLFHSPAEEQAQTIPPTSDAPSTTSRPEESDKYVISVPLGLEPVTPNDNSEQTRQSQASEPSDSEE